MTKKITILLLGLVLGANIHSGENEVQKEQVTNKKQYSKIKHIGGTIAKYLLYIAAAYDLKDASVELCRGLGRMITAHEMKGLLQYASKDEIYEKAKEISTEFSLPGKMYILNGMFAVIFACGLYKAACMIHDELAKNKEVQQEATASVSTDIV